MRLLVRTPDVVRLSYLIALLDDAGIVPLVLDQHISALEGGIGAFPRRLMVAEADYAAALRVLALAGEATEPEPT